MPEEPEPSSRLFSLKPPSIHHSRIWQNILGLFGFQSQVSAREQLQGILNDAGSQEDDLTVQERLLFKNILILNNTRVDDVMVPRADIAGLDVTTPLGEALHAYKEAGHSRFLIYRETLDDPIGLIHIKDIMGYMADQGEQTEPSEDNALSSNSFFAQVDFSTPLGKLQLTRSLLYVPPSMPAHDLLIQMQTTRKHLAVVIDEYGGTDGIISIEDLLEVVVGDIEDEHDIEEKPQLKITGNNTVIADARLEISDLISHFQDDFKVGDDADDVDTLGGLIFSVLGRIPAKGECVLYSGYELEVLDVDARRIKQLKVSQKAHKKPERRATKSAQNLGIGLEPLSQAPIKAENDDLQLEHSDAAMQAEGSHSNIVEMPLKERPRAISGNSE